MDQYLLYGMKESGNAYKVALMLELTNTPWEPVWVDFFNGETRGEAFRENINEMGEVPVLEKGDFRLTQSGVILDYLAAETGQFGGSSAAEKRENSQMDTIRQSQADEQHSHLSVFDKFC